MIEEIGLFEGSLATTPMGLQTPLDMKSVGIFSTKGINDIHIETSEMKMMKKRVVTPVK